MERTTTPLVSVVIPTYGRPEFLPDAVESVAAQTYPNVELVVVDDHSPEPVEPVLSALSLGTLEWRCLRHEENEGANAARRTGIESTDGEIVAFLDDDDYWEPTAVERIVEAFLAGGPEVGAVAAGVRIVDADGEQIGRTIPEYDGDITERILRGELQAATFSRFAVRRSAVEAAGYPDERFPSWQDKEWHIRLSQHCRYASVAEPLVVRRVTGHGQITDDFERKRDVSYPLLVEKHGSLAATYGSDCARQFVGHLNATLGFSALRNGYYRDAVVHLLRSLRYDPTRRSTYGYLALALTGPVSYPPARRLKQWLSGRGSVPG
ncbi:Glycosyltransferase involved in cell wall bisynthesis [Halogranum amylolyticum]|uniref:Glycosyltransferase involved in cell wall bisynthesis n=1 Tax=Halogranum amylolyticum TaxID=660520 RepID=A0A1H8MZY8_9EURY|nr:glycosyltransferase family 2 protein [Halogranum amylolyticum]SEO22829.1 Glycosyltransferase involved in cell wall bisynthesis [Halogranum amylolyticum]